MVVVRIPAVKVVWIHDGVCGVCCCVVVWMHDGVRGVCCGCAHIVVQMLLLFYLCCVMCCGVGVATRLCVLYCD